MSATAAIPMPGFARRIIRSLAVTAGVIAGTAIALIAAAFAILNALDLVVL